MLTPEYHQNFHLSDKSDVYSFGVVLVEIITALKVVDLSRRNSEVNLAALAIDKIGKGRVDELIDPLLEPHRDAWTLSSIHKVAELAFRCLAFHGDMRPSMTEVADELEQIRLSGWAPSDGNVTKGSLSVTSSSSSPNGIEKAKGGLLREHSSPSSNSLLRTLSASESTTPTTTTTAATTTSAAGGTSYRAISFTPAIEAIAIAEDHVFVLD
ncbi:wall-associated receptor kinase-like protein 14 [Tanacetum coccineum]